MAATRLSRSVEYAVYCIHITMYSLQSTIYSVRRTVYCVHLTVYTLKCTAHLKLCSLYNIFIMVDNVECRFYIVYCNIKPCTVWYCTGRAISQEATLAPRVALMNWPLIHGDCWKGFCNTVQYKVSTLLKTVQCTLCCVL